MTATRKRRRTPSLEVIRASDGADLAEQPDLTAAESTHATEQAYCDGCGQLCEPESSTGSGELLCATCTAKRLAEPELPESSPILNTDELAAIRKRLMAGTHDSLDVGVLFDHIAAMRGCYDALVDKTRGANDTAQAMILERDLTIEHLRDELARLTGETR